MVVGAKATYISVGPNLQWGPGHAPVGLGDAEAFLPARRYASAGNSDRNVSVCQSVTSRYCVKTKTAIVMIS